MRALVLDGGVLWGNVAVVVIPDVVSRSLARDELLALSVGGRASKSPPEAIRRFIIRRARQLGLSSLVLAT